MKKTITVSEVLKLSETNELYSLKLRDASRFAANASGEMEFATSIWHSRRIGGYRADILKATLDALVGKGEVYMAFARIDRPIVAELVR